MEGFAQLVADQMELIAKLQLEKLELAEVAEKADARAEELQEQFDALRPTEKTYLDLRRYIREDKNLIKELEDKAEALDTAVKSCYEAEERDTEKQETLDFIRDRLADHFQAQGLGSYPEIIPDESLAEIVKELEKYTYERSNA